MRSRRTFEDVLSLELDVSTSVARLTICILKKVSIPSYHIYPGRNVAIG